MSEPTERRTIAQRVRDVLVDLNTAFERDRSDGVSISDMGRAVGVSHSEMSRILSGEHKLGVEQALKLPTRARRAVMAILVEENDIIDGARALALTAESRARRLTALVGSHNSILDEALADGVIDRAEHSRLRASALLIVAESTAAVRDGSRAS